VEEENCRDKMILCHRLPFMFYFTFAFIYASKNLKVLKTYKRNWMLNVGILKRMDMFSDLYPGNPLMLQPLIYYVG
jgi:hypothetical protein